MAYLQLFPDIFDRVGAYPLGKWSEKVACLSVKSRLRILDDRTGLVCLTAVFFFNILPFTTSFTVWLAQ